MLTAMTEKVLTFPPSPADGAAPPKREILRLNLTRRDSADGALAQSQSHGRTPDPELASLRVRKRLEAKQLL